MELYGAYIYTEKGFIKIYFYDRGENTLVRVKRYYNGKSPVCQEIILYNRSARSFRNQSIFFLDSIGWKKANIRPVKSLKLYYNQ